MGMRLGMSLALTGVLLLYRDLIPLGAVATAVLFTEQEAAREKGRAKKKKNGDAGQVLHDNVS